jgi:hypothetical protein
MSNCAIIDADGQVVSVIIADPTTDKPYAGHSLVPLPAGVRVDHTWRHSHERGFHQTDDEFNNQHRLQFVPAWNDSAEPYSFETPAATVLEISKGRTVQLMAARGNHSFKPGDCGGYTWTDENITDADTCASFVSKVVEDIKIKKFDPDWALDWLVAQCTLFPPQLSKLIFDVLPANKARLAKRYLAGQGVSL